MGLRAEPAVDKIEAIAAPEIEAHLLEILQALTLTRSGLHALLDVFTQILRDRESSFIHLA